MATRKPGIRRWAAAAVLVLVCAGVLNAETAHRVDVRGLRVVGSGYSGEGEVIRPFNWDRGTTLACLLVLTEGGIIGFDEERCRVHEFVDSRGNDLMDKASMIRSGIGQTHNISRDDRAVLFEITGDNLPAEDADYVKASGILNVKTASKQEKVQIYGLSLKKGAEFEAGGMRFLVSRVESPEWAEGKLNVTFQVNQHPSKIVSMQFKDDDGNPIFSSLVSSGRFTINNRATYDQTYGLAEEIDEVNIDIVYWSDVKTRKLPFSVKAALGL